MPKLQKLKKKNYSQKDLCAAIESYKAGTSLQCASQKYNVPKSTIYFKTKGIVPIDAAMGPSTYLTKNEEEKLVEWIFYLGERGFAVTKDQLLDAVRDLVIQLERKTPFVENRPGRHWYESFLRRHPTISTRLAQNLTTTRASATEERLRNWFSKVQIYLDKNGLNGIDATRVYSCDESGFSLCPQTGHVLAKNGVEKECLNTLFMINAAGKMVPPMIVYAYKRVPFNIIRKVPKEWAIGVTDNGWMTEETFYEYIANIFHPWLVKNNTQFPVILFLDDHSSHFTLPLVTFCRTVQIELVALYPNATHIVQPLDGAIFHPLKSAWHKAVLKWRVENNGKRLRKEDFAPLLKETIDSMENLGNMTKNGFKTCGLYPFSADAVNFNILNKNKKSNTAEKENINENETVNREESYAQHLDLFEKTIDSKVLQDFIKAESSGSWTGQINLEGLFMYWMNIKEKCGRD